jgi:UPF0716 family protein affecting phage T7 exclusion
MERQLILAIVSVVAVLLVGWAIALLVLIALPCDYLRGSRIAHPWRSGYGLIDKAWLVLKNVLGSMLVLIGGILSVPLIPGPGFLIVVAGLLLLDFPAKHRMLRRLLGRPVVLRSINRLRDAFAREPLLID